MGKVIESAHYHVWTDALHGRQLALEANNKWDAGTYARWAILSAWIALEVACQDALEEKDISYSFRKIIDKAIEAKRLQKINWGAGLWQKVTSIQEKRKDYVHRIISQPEITTDPEEANDAIITIRNAIKDIYRIAGKPHPIWVDDDSDRGYDLGPRGGAHLFAPRYDPDAPDAILITYVMDGREHRSTALPPNGNIDEAFDETIKGAHRPVSIVRASQGGKVIKERKLKMRGG